MRQHVTKSAMYIALIGVSTFSMAATETPPANVLNLLKFVSAGHTGCLPGEIDLSNIDMAQDARSNLWGGLWNATCNGKLYLCTAVRTNNSESFSCAPVPSK